MGNLTKRNILWLVPIGIIVVFWYFYGPKKDITDNEYITYVKSYTFENSSQSLEESFNQACKNTKWIYFETQKRQDVVELEGECPVDNKNEKINIQFLVDRDMTKVTKGALLINSKQQEETARDEFIVAITE